MQENHAKLHLAGGEGQWIFRWTLVALEGTGRGYKTTPNPRFGHN